MSVGVMLDMICICVWEDAGHDVCLGMLDIMCVWGVLDMMCGRGDGQDVCLCV